MIKCFNSNNLLKITFDKKKRFLINVRYFKTQPSTIVHSKELPCITITFEISFFSFIQLFFRLS